MRDTEQSQSQSQSQPRDAGCRPIVCLHDRSGAADWFAAQVDHLGARVIEPHVALTGDALDEWVSWSAREIEAVGEPVHVLATGIAAHGAVVLAVRHPELVVSLLLGDPADESPSTERDLLGRVTTPTLVIASQPDGGRASSAEPDGGRESVSSAAQALAGGIDNGVFVVIDGAAVPAHRERGASFDEWVTSFTIIAEGLGALGAHRQEEVHV